MKFANGYQSPVVGDEWRYDKILKLQQDMKKELIKYETVYKRYKKGDNL